MLVNCSFSQQQMLLITLRNVLMSWFELLGFLT